MRRGSVFPWVLLIISAGGAIAAVAHLDAQLKHQQSALKKEKKRSRQAQERAEEYAQRLREAGLALQQEREVIAQTAEELARAKSKASEADELARKLHEAMGSEEGDILRDKDKLTLQLVDKVLFRTAEADLTERGEKVIGRVGEVLKEFRDKQVWIQGHAERVPIRSERFPSNWELSTARAVNVVHYLQDKAGIDPKRLAAVGFGEYRPASRKKKAQNRRIEIVLFPEDVEMTRSRKAAEEKRSATE